MRFTRLTGHIGADVHGTDLSQPLGPKEVREIREGLIEHLVLFFREQRMLTPEEHKRFAGYFGELEHQAFLRDGVDDQLLVLDAPNSEIITGESFFHADSSWRRVPPLGAVLQAQILPNVGGDTCFASMYAAYEAFSPQMRSFLDGLEAYHSIERMAAKTRPGYRVHSASGTLKPTKHPVVCTHPESGRKLLNVNGNYTLRIDGLHDDESAALLTFLFEHVKSPHFQVRMRWNVGDVAFWDNRACLHCAIPDYTERRRMQRVSVLPFGVDTRVDAGVDAQSVDAV